MTDHIKPPRRYDVVVIGAGATGAGTARDCAMRGLKVLLVERFDFTAGATGRNHGLLHSGARYAVTDGESATECIKENMTLRRIAAHCVEETGGLFVTLPEDSLDYQKTFVESCLRAGINAEIIDPGRGSETRACGQSRYHRSGQSARWCCRPFPAHYSQCSCCASEWSRYSHLS